MLLAAAGCSCSLLRGQPIESLPVARQDADGRMELLQRAPYLYRVQIDGAEAFFTAIEDCRKRGDSPVQSLTRQLLVGLRQPRIAAQQQVQIAARSALRSLVLAEYEQRQLSLVAYTVNQDDCLRDYVFWTPSGRAAAERAVPQFDRLMQRFLTGQLAEQ